MPATKCEVTLSASEARHLLMDRQGLCLSPARKLSDDALLELIIQMGFVQVDSIRTVERAHHMILYSRSQCYRPEQLQRLLEQDRRLFEHWTHDASIIPVNFYPYWRRRIKRDENRLKTRFYKSRDAAYKSEVTPVLRHVRRNGEVMARDLKKTPAGSSQGWWQWHPSKTALEFLWHNGKLAVSRREGFQKVYDLVERVIDDSYAKRMAGVNEYIDWACRAALVRLGTATVGEIAAFWNGVSIAEVKAWVARQSSESLVTVGVQNLDGSALRQSLMLQETLGELPSLADIPSRLRILSPFDPLIRDRKRCLRLFGFDYRIEVFVPASRRRYGYYVFPVLHKDRLVGRIDMKADRQTSRLNVSGLWWEPGVRVGVGRVRALESELDRLCRFVGLDSVHFNDNVRSALSTHH